MAYIEHYDYYTQSTQPKSIIEDTFSNPLPSGEFIVPLPLRTQSPSDLLAVSYPNVSSCQDIPQKWPVDPGNALDSRGNVVWKNVFNDMPILPDRLDALRNYTPIDSDPFLPWIHDTFSSQDGTTVQFVTQNKRRCNTGNKFLEISGI